MRKLFTPTIMLVSLSLLTAIVTATATAQAPEKRTLAIFDITPTSAVAQRAQQDGKKNELDRIIQSLDGQLIDRMQNTRKFAIVAHSDLAALIGGSAFNPDALKKLAKESYALEADVDSFQDVFSPVENNVAYRAIQFSMVAKIYNTATAEILETANFQGVYPLQNIPGPITGSDPTDKLLVWAARDMAMKLANRVASVLYPSKVIDVTDKQVTLNWGDGMFIAVGEVWDVRATKVKVDPDTGDKHIIEIPVGQIKIIEVLPDSSRAEIIGPANLGIAEGCIARKAQTAVLKTR